MRPLAIARFRLWTTIRAATPMFAIAIVPPLVAAVVEVFIERWSLAAPDNTMSVSATASLLSWLFHGFIVFSLAHEFGKPKMAYEATVHPGDLMDSVPITRPDRFLGELTGVFTTGLLLHACCLPLLAVVAALSPLPTIVFVWIEAAIVAALILASASASWRRVTMGASQWRSTRATRNMLLFYLLAILCFVPATDLIPFRDAAFSFLTSPSMRAWSRVTMTIDNPVLLVVLLATIYVGYIAFFFISATRRPLQA